MANAVCPTGQHHPLIETGQYKLGQAMECDGFICMNVPQILPIKVESSECIKTPTVSDFFKAVLSGFAALFPSEASAAVQPTGPYK